ncbi:glycoside hydrolase [Nonomuraea sp. NBC_01738]|uniref:sialidase family protein n=1 Tax=Nonomuraea sp. NBC_01738 TaxID=2976003 RepID=UPI002E0F3017|nr:glycoside hydrolase [Nonomuraea sp. NBC_01738]
MDVSEPVTVFAEAARKPDGELAHEGNRVPDIVALDADRLVVAWRTGAADPIDPDPRDQGSIGFARSADGGRTWVSGTLAAATTAHRYHYVIFLNDGGVLYAFLGRIATSRDRDQRGQVDGFPVELVALRSADGGGTWADFPLVVDVPANARGVVLAGKPVRHRGLWLLPYWENAGVGVLRSADLRTWRRGGLAVPPRGIAVEEPQVVLSQDDPDALLLVARTLVSGTAEQKDADYRSNRVARLDLAPVFTGVRTRAGGTWDPGPRGDVVVTASGEFAVESGDLVLEGRTEGLYGNGLLVAAARPGPWRVVAGPDGRVRLLGSDAVWAGRARGPVNVRGTGLFEVEVADCLAAWPQEVRLSRTSVTKPIEPGDFTIEFLGEAVDAPLEAKVANGAKRLVLMVRRDEVWAMRKGSPRWEPVYGHPGGPAVWKARVDSAGVATLFRDGADTGVSWVVQDSAERPHAAHWSQGEAVVWWSVVSSTAGR